MTQYNSKSSAERIVMLIKVFKALSFVVLILFALSLFGFGVKNVVRGGKDLAFIAGPINGLISFPETMLEVIKTVFSGVPPTYHPIDEDFEELNQLGYDVYGLNGFFDASGPNWEVRLFNLRNDSLIMKWTLQPGNYYQTERNFANSEPRNPILLPGGSLIVGQDESNNLFRIDEDSKVLWHNTEHTIHHAMNPSADGHIWVCTRGYRRAISPLENLEVEYQDDYITKVDAETGETLINKSVSEILLENGYTNFVYGFSNTVGFRVNSDPLHLNDIEPVYQDSTYWKEGDLLLSIRNRSLILLYRPDTNEVIRLIYGSFINQHDVDIISPTEISIFNNNVTNFGSTELSDQSLLPQDHLDGSDIVIYNFADSSFRHLMKEQMLREEIITRSQGFHTLLSNGDLLVESQNEAKVFVFNHSNTLLRKYFHTSVDGMVERPHWMRIYENISTYYE